MSSLNITKLHNILNELNQRARIYRSRIELGLRVAQEELTDLHAQVRAIRTAIAFLRAYNG